ncbi:MAG: hypothetical protein M3P51_02495 [Chloroflexota bacterium]|nr:hypothetical protein [Chloroflexota bacterium]
MQCSTTTSIYYDYTSPYSYRALLWLWRLQRAGRELDLVWKTLSLKEVNRHEGDPSIFERVQMESTSILALELAKAAQATELRVFRGSVRVAVTGGKVEVKSGSLP